LNRDDNMQLFLRDNGTVVLDACEQTTIAELKAAYAARRAYGDAAKPALVGTRPHMICRTAYMRCC
jgi:hypothetical protein